ncbi:hypothetical protein [Ferruginibacter albus]|uniref:hypothetical protein n=1 Tax=Ferruginibacter albus TaxID=2875540 RepID=UPI001CC6992A|nr:hypothetical protein [Ferruginibacter albus]UAY52473.1 hypothetical protein K9M53_01995 [Ferruginibacter albus]
MQLIPVNDKVTAKEFLQVAVELYKNDTNWIRPLDKDINEVFDTKKNKAYRFGETARWVLKDDNGRLIGRIAAYANKKYRNKGDDVPVGGIGFFECINNQDAADLLFDNAKHWLIQHGMEAMDGPINFGERDRWWGLVTKGHDEPLYCMNYNPPYYVALFEDYGFQPFFGQVCFGMDPKKPFPKKIYDRHAKFSNDPDFSSKHIDKSQLEKFAQDFVTVYNKAWAGHGGLKQMAKEQAVILFKTMKPVMDEKIIWYAYHKDEPIAIFINLPDLNQWFKYLNGKFDLLHKLKFLWVKKNKPNKKLTGIVFGVVPEWQGKGVDNYIIVEASNKYIITNQSPYSEYEMQWIGDFNPKMINVAESLGDVFRNRNLTTYRYLFDRMKEFKRHPMV